MSGDSKSASSFASDQSKQQDLALYAQGLVKRFGAKTAVRDATFQVAKKCIFGFLGPNGAGKTTVLRLLLGLLQPDAGEARVLGLDPRRRPQDIRLRTGYVSQLHSLYGDLTVDENLRFFGQLYGLAGKDLAKRVAEQKERFLLEEDSQPVAALGTGEQRRAALACALVHEPELLILDEPTSGMDSLTRREFWTFLGGLAAAGTTVVITTHHLEEAEICDNLALIVDGKIAFQGSPKALKARYAGPVLVVQCEPWDAGFTALRRHFGAALFGTASHVDSTAATPQEVEEALRRAGVRLLSLEERPPTIEDAFLRATQGGENGEQFR